MLLVVGVELWITWRTAVDAANAAYDRSLLGAIKSIDANISTDSGGLAVELPYRMLEFFELTASGSVYYRVATEDGLVEIGNADLPPPVHPLATGRPQFNDSNYFGDPVRIGSYARLLPRPLAGQEVAQRVVIQVAETLTSREQFTHTLVLQALTRDLVLVLVAGVLLVLVIGWALRPLARLRNEVQTRSPLDLTPIASEGIPVDVQPLVEAINHHVERTRRLGEARRRFIDDASHQLRTPLTTLTTQVGFALREPDPDRLHGALLAVKAQLDETVRQTNQMLALARTDSADVASESIALASLAEEGTRAWWAEARARRIDLGLEVPAQPVWVQAHPGLLKEALSNLLHNALRYTPPGGHVTVHVTAEPGAARLMVVDNGPGIPAPERDRAGERFFRASNASQPGSGLGLAIVRSIAERHGGRLEVGVGPQGQGLSVTMILPLPPS
ncbi:MAG: sensor histidine kinase N-terminal domain-containing protein [Burkholderiales bacterium]|nr:sensor histidine kinase N-terminal domain-containing protein [Burkholderiales bacterium]